jgi:hypothetical protein
MDASRTNIALWLVTRDAAALAASLTVTEIVRLGSNRDLPASWGAAAFTIDGCWCFVSPERRQRDDVRGYWKFGASSALSTDLPVRIAEHLAALKLPAALVAPIMPAATADWLWHTTIYAPDDWIGLTVWPRLLDAKRVESYVLRLIADGVLVADGGERR